MKFRVIDRKTGKEADPYEIALNEEWAQSLIYCDMEGFAITEDGNLVLMDECGQVVYCDTERFKVVFEDERPHGECNHCRYYEGVHGVQGHAPCSFWGIGGVLWSDYCSRFEKEGES